jgi:hypothetical protein
MLHTHSLHTHRFFLNNAHIAEINPTNPLGMKGELAKKVTREHSVPFVQGELTNLSSTAVHRSLASSL